VQDLKEKKSKEKADKKQQAKFDNLFDLCLSEVNSKVAELQKLFKKNQMN